MGYPDLFADLVLARSKPRTLMNVVDASSVCSADDSMEKQICKMHCKKCGVTSDWLELANVTAAKRGISCVACNKQVDMGNYSSEAVA